jgi:hypothetical protein
MLSQSVRFDWVIVIVAGCMNGGASIDTSGCLFLMETGAKHPIEQLSLVITDTITKRPSKEIKLQPNPIILQGGPLTRIKNAIWSFFILQL